MLDLVLNALGLTRGDLITYVLVAVAAAAWPLALKALAWLRDKIIISPNKADDLILPLIEALQLEASNVKPEQVKDVSTHIATAIVSVVGARQAHQVAKQVIKELPAVIEAQVVTSPPVGIVAVPGNLISFVTGFFGKFGKKS